jgi:hypothetical protein
MNTARSNLLSARLQPLSIRNDTPGINSSKSETSIPQSQRSNSEYLNGGSGTNYGYESSRSRPNTRGPEMDTERSNQYSGRPQTNGSARSQRTARDYMFDSGNRSGRNSGREDSSVATMNSIDPAIFIAQMRATKGKSIILLLYLLVFRLRFISSFPN